MAEKRTPSQRGKYARRSGHDFERLLVRTFKETFEDCEWAEKVRRTDQGHKAHLCDVWGVPGLWIEAGKGAAAHPEKKMAQAVRDTALHGGGLVPIAILKPKRATHDVYIRLKDLVSEFLTCGAKPAYTNPDTIVKFCLEDSLALYRDCGLHRKDPLED